MDSTIWHIYGLRNPITHQLFYIGMTKNLYERFMQHLRMEDDNEGKNTVILCLQIMGTAPELITLAVAYTEKEARKRESHHIKLNQALKQPLTNREIWTGYKPSNEEQKELDSITRQSIEALDYSTRKMNWFDRWIHRWTTKLFVGNALYEHSYGTHASKVQERYNELFKEITKSRQVEQEA